jgi:hypothetical protein
VNACTDESGVLLPGAAALQRVAETVWSQSAGSFDDVAVTVYRTQDDPASARDQFTSAELEARSGQRPPSLIWVGPDLLRGTWLLYLALPMILLALSAPIVLGVFAARRGVVVLFWRA